jgi:hypothetical protein
MMKKPKVKKLPTVKYKTSATDNVKKIAGQSYIEQRGPQVQLCYGLDIAVNRWFKYYC